MAVGGRHTISDPRHVGPTDPASRWTDERVELLTKLWVDGFSCAQIAKQLGGVSRNAVIGKVSRLGLEGRDAAYKPGRPGSAGRAPVQTRVYIAPKVTPLPPPAALLPGSAPRPWLTRRFGECAYPAAGDGGDTLSCCAKTPKDATYCTYHHKLMHAPPPTDAQRARAARARAAKHMLASQRARAA